MTINFPFKSDSSNLPKSLTSMQVYNIMCDVAVTINGKTEFYEYKTFSKSRAEAVFTVPPKEKAVITKIILTGYRPYTGPVKISIGDGDIDHIQPKGESIRAGVAEYNKYRPIVSPRTQFCHCPITDLMRGGCACGGV